MKINQSAFKIFGDGRGSLISLEEGNNIPFPIKRIYYIFNTTQGTVRGFHAHKSLNQILVAVSGSCRIILDDGQERQEIILDRPELGLLIQNQCIWREMHDFSPDCVLMVIADQIYDESDYLRDYKQFLNYKKTFNHE
ncbi:MAG: FdtA/QdtA family cupin domain-containing protein [Akkermansia sp.]